MTDFARLLVEFDTTAMKRGLRDFEEVIRVGEQVEKTAQRVGGAQREAGTSSASAAQQTSKLGAELQRAATSGNAFAQSYIKVDSAITDLAMAQARATAEITAAKAAYKSGEIAIEQYNRQVLQTKSALAIVQSEYADALSLLKRHSLEAHNSGQRIVATAGEQRVGMQQLSYQIADVAQQFALGINPMVIFAQQGGQVVQAIALMRGSASGFMAFLAGPWGAALMGGAMVLGLLIPKLMDTKKAMDDVKLASNAMSDAQSILSGVMDLTTGKVINQSAAFHDLAVAQAAVAEVQARIRQSEAKSAMEGMAASRMMIGGGLVGLSVSKGYRPESGILDSVLKGQMTGGSAIKQLENLYKLGQLTEESYIAATAAVANFAAEGENIKIYGKLKEGLDGDKAALQGFLKLKDDSKNKSDKHAESLQRETEAIEAQIHGLWSLAIAYEQGDAAALKAEVQARATAQGIKKQADVELWVSQQLRLAIAQRAVDGAQQVADLKAETSVRSVLNSQLKQGLITEQEAADALQLEMTLRPLIAASVLAEGAAKTELTTIINNLREAQRASNEETTRSRDIAMAQEQTRRTASLRDEISLTQQLGDRRVAATRGVSGRALEEELADINAEYERGMVDIEAQATSTEQLSKGLKQAAQATLDNAEARKELIDLRAKFDAEARAAQYLAEQVDALGSSLSNSLGGTGVGGILGSLLGVFSSNNPLAGLLGMGGLGTLAGAVLSSGQSDSAYNKMADKIADGIKEVFGTSGEFANTMAKVMQGAGIGSVVGGMVFNSKGGQFGSMAGGALGQAFGEKLFGGTLSSIASSLGAAAGPLGAIAGSLIGGMLGGMLSKTKKGSATFNSSGLVSTAGNSQSRIQSGISMGGGVGDVLQQMADQLGTSLGDFSYSIGVRKKSIVLDPTGQGRTKGAGVLNFGQDQEAAIQAAIKDAISDGVFNGLSDGVQRLLKGDGDVQTNLKKALSFQGVFSDLQAKKDPLGAALSDIDTWHTSMVKLFDEAGATGEQLAQLEELYGLKRAEAIESAGKDQLERERAQKELQVQILELEGKSAEALALSRAMELDSMEESLRPLQERIYALQDEAEQAALAAQIASERASLEQRLHELQGDTVWLRAQELAALDPSNRALLERIYALEDEQAAAERLAESQREQAAALAAIQAEAYDLQTRLLQAQGDTNALRARELETLDPSNRAILEQIFALEDLKAAQEAAASAAEALAAKEREIAQERYSLETRLYTLLGDTARLRARELEQLDPSNRSLQEEIWAIEDRQAAEKTAAEQAKEAAKELINQRKELISQYQAEAKSLGSLAEKFNKFAADIREFRASLFAPKEDVNTRYGLAERQFSSTAFMASLGSETALQSFIQVSKDFLDASLEHSATLLAYKTDLGRVANASDMAISASESTASQAGSQAALLYDQIRELEELNKATEASLKSLDGINTSQQQGVLPTLQALLDSQESAVTVTATNAEDSRTALTAILVATNEVARLLSRVVVGNYIAVGNDTTDPLVVTNA